MGTPAAFDPLKHHVGLGVDTSTLYGLLLGGGYSKQLANPVVSKPSDIGTDDLIGQRSLSNWTQDDYSGGEFQEDWSDPAMFAECVGMLPDQLSRRVRTIRPLDAFLTAETQANINPVGFDSILGFLFLVFNNSTPVGKVHCYNPALPGSSPQKETVSSTYLPAGKLITAAVWNTSSNRLWLGSNKPQIDTFTYDHTAGSGSRLIHQTTFNTPTNPAVTEVDGIHIFGLLKLIVTQNTAAGAPAAEDNSDVWLYVSGSGAATKWTHVGTLPGNLVCSITYNNAVYYLSRNANAQTFLSMTQGTQIFPVLTLPYFFRGQAMVEYAGRLYIGGTGFDLDGNDHHGELYEVSGASLRLVRTFGGQVNDPTPGTTTNLNGASGNKPIKRKRVMNKMACLCVAEGLLWMPDSSWTGLEAYDATTDAFFGGPRYRLGQDATINFTDMVPYGDSIYVWGNGPDTARTGLYRTERLADSGHNYESYLVTSDFHPEPARQKFWSRLVVHSRTRSPTLYYSLDSGDSWFLVGTGTTTTTGNRLVTTYDLQAATVPPSTAIRFKFQYNQDGSANEVAAYHVAHSLSFLVRGDTKRLWQFTVNASLLLEDINLNSQSQVPIDISTALWTLKDNSVPIKFRDVDRADYNVVVTSISEQFPGITPDVERFINVTLLEV